MDMTLALDFFKSAIKGHFSLGLVIVLGVLISLHQGVSTVVPIGSCILIYSESCPRSEIQFFLFTRNNPNTSEFVYFSDVYDNVTSSSFNSSLPNKIIVHGYDADMNLDVLQNIKTAYLQKGDFNLWFVNWPDLCRSPCYIISVYNLDQVGKCLSQMINRLKKYITVEPDFHIIGFSLGAHVAAYTSKYLKPQKVQRITGLDPAMPMFASRDKDNRLDMEDAKFVDVIHTSAFMQGQFARSGHVDFYMNGGIEQPGCRHASNPFDCNHRRAPQYFAESIHSEEGFWGWPCAGMLNYILDMCPVKTPFILMGEKCLNESRGFFIVPTKSDKPYAKGPNMTQLSKPNQISNETKSVSKEKKNKSGKRVKGSGSGTNSSKEVEHFKQISKPIKVEKIQTKERLVIEEEAKSTVSLNDLTVLTSTEIIDERFTSKGTEIEFAELTTEVTESSGESFISSEAPTTLSAEASKYRFIYRVPRKEKSSMKSV